MTGKIGNKSGHLLIGKNAYFNASIGVDTPDEKVNLNTN